MIMSKDDAITKYYEYIVAISDTKKLLEKEGIKIVASNDFELGAEWLVSYKDKPIAEIMWNIPYMLSFNPRVEQSQEEFSLDYVKNVKDWREFLSDMSTSILTAKKDTQ